MEKANNKTEQERRSLKNKLDWAVSNLEESIEKARFLSDMLFDDFFSYREFKTQEDINEVMLGYKNAAITHDIMIDYLEEMQSDIKTLAEIINVLPTNKQEEVTEL